MIRRDIARELEDAHRMGRTLGMNFDDRAWRDLVAWIDAQEPT